jgi:hypothetical protein
LRAALSIAVSIRINIGLTALDQRLALLRKIQLFGRTPSMFWSATSSAKGSPNLVTRESKCRRITVRPWHGRCSLSGDSIKANTRRGVFRVNHGRRLRVIAQLLVTPRSRENCMKEATKRAASEALAQMLAVTAMLVIASIIFYSR